MLKIVVPDSLYSANERAKNPALLELAKLLTLDQVQNSVVRSEIYQPTRKDAQK